MADFGLLEVKSPADPELGHTATVIFIHGINGHRIGSWTVLNKPVPGEAVDLANTTEQVLTGTVIEKSKDDNHEDTEAPVPVGLLETPLETDIGAGDQEGKEDNRQAAENVSTIPEGNAETTGGERQEGTGTLQAADLIALKVPNARIMTYGYDFGANRGSQDIMSKAWIQQVARKLLEALWAGQERCSGKIDTTPLVFICHDLGGVIVKEMLWLANNERLHLPIAVRAQLLVFFGAPHKESTDSPWEDLVFDIALASTELRRESRRDILTAIIKAGAGGVRDTSERFNQLVGQYRTLNFFACKSSSTTGSVVVPEICATSNWPLEEHFSRDVDHLSMCRLSDLEDPALLQLCTRIEAVTGKASQGSFDVRQTFSTRSPQRNWPILPPMEAATVQWIIANGSVTSWLASETFSILHIHGQAGSGKTVFTASMEKYLQGAGSEYGSTAVISFSFDGSSYRGRSFSNMLESLIQELLAQSPSVDVALTTIHKQIMECPPTGENPIWTQEALCLVFSAAVDIFEHPILCIIDGVQDCDGTRNDMLQYLVGLGRERTGAPFKVVITSRESLTGLLLDPGNVGPERSFFTVELDNEQVVHGERHRIIKTRLTDFLASAVTSIPVEDVETVISKFCGLSLTFLEVDLIIKRFQAQLPTLSSVINLRLALDKLASNSSAPLPLIFERALNFDAGTQGDWDFVERVIPWLIYSEQPLTLNQLAVVQNLEEEMNPFSAAGLESLRSKDIPGILQRTLGSLIVIDGDKIVFLHDSAVEFLTKHARLGSSVRDAAKVHSKIASKCLEYLNSSELAGHDSFVHDSNSPQLALPESASGAYNFLTYAAHHWPTHQRLASRDAGDIDSFFQRFIVFTGSSIRLHWWQELYHYLETDSLVSKVAAKTGALYPSTALNIASFFGLEPVVERLLTTEGDSEPEVGLRTSLELAAWNNYADVVRTIVRFCSSAYSEVGWDAKNTAMRSACSVGNDEIVKILLGAKPVVDLELNACLHIACGAGHLRVVVMLVEAGADVNTADDTKKTPLHHAAETGYYRVIRQLLSLGADLSAADDDGYTALHFAAMNGHLTAVRVLLSQPDSDINTVRWSIKPLHLAAKNGHVALVKELLRRGAEYSVADVEGSTPLHMAAAGGFSKTMQMLLDEGADACATNKSGQTPLHLATGSLKAVKLLLDHGADPDAATYDTRRRPLHAAAAGGQLSVLRLLLECGATIDPPLQDSKVTPLLLAAWHEEPQCLDALLNAGANPHWKCGDWTEVHSHANEMTALHLTWGHVGMTEALLKYSTGEARAMNAKKRTPFYYAFSGRTLETSRMLLELYPGSLNEVDDEGWHAAHSASQTGSLEFLKLMLEYGQDLNVVEQETGSTPLLVATRAQESETVKWLIENGADINVRDEGLWSLLHFATNEGHLEITQTLVEAGSDVNATESAGVVPLHLAARNKNGTECVRYLLDHGADVHLKEQNDSWNAAHYAAYAGELESLKVLTDAGVEVGIFDKCGWTPLHRACQSGSLECVLYLLEKGVDLQARDTNLLSPLTAATYGGNFEILKLLFERGLRVDERDEEEWTPLVGAAENGFVEGASFLLDQGANIEARTTLGDTPLMHAAAAGKAEVVRLLCEKGADIQTRNNKGQSVMQKAATAKGEHAPDIIQALIGVGLALDERDQAGRTLLFNSAGASAAEVTRFLLEKGVDKEAVDEVGRKAIDVCLSHETRTILGWCPEEGAIPPTCTSDIERSQDDYKAFCDIAEVCTGKYMTNDFFYHCCGCVDDTYVICIPCYDNGARCKNPEEHTLKLRYLGQGLISVEEYSPWVKLCTLPKDLEK